MSVMRAEPNYSEAEDVRPDDDGDSLIPTVAGRAELETETVDGLSHARYGDLLADPKSKRMPG